MPDAIGSGFLAHAELEDHQRHNVMQREPIDFGFWRTERRGQHHRLIKVLVGCLISMKPMLLLALFLVAVSSTAAEKPYDFRTSAAYAKLSSADRHRLEQVRHDQVLLWGALDMFADEHNGNPPLSLDDLVPRYLVELPADPFASQQKAGAQALQGYTPSKEGAGYQFRGGAAGNRAWVIASAGLPDFPYLAERGNVGLYICKGLWIPDNPAMGKLFKGQAAGRN